MVIKTGRFGELEVDEAEVLQIPQGILGFPEYVNFCLVDPADDTLILWLQSIENPALAFPVLEPRIFKSDYTVRLSGVELRELKLENVNQAAVFNIITIPEDISEMTANLKAPVVINLTEKIAKQVVLQENEYNVKHRMFMELKRHLLTIQAHRDRVNQDMGVQSPVALVKVGNIKPSVAVRTLQT